MFAVSKNPTIREIHALYKQGKSTPIQIVQFFLNRSKQVDREIKAVLRYPEKLTIEEAKHCEYLLQEYQSKETSSWFEDLLQDYPLFGIPYSLKDNILVAGEIVTSGSKILQDYRASYSATAYLKVKQAGAILLSQTNQDEFAMGSSTENSAYQITRNPLDLDRVPGGSSGGPAAAVASGQVVFSLGSDTGGSIRQPAAFCNLVGLKPTYGAVSRYGLMAMASSLDQIGPFTNNVYDNLLVFKSIMGQDPNDQTSQNTNELRQSLDSLLAYFNDKLNSSRKIVRTDKPFKIGLIRELLGEGVEPQISSRIRDLSQELARLGHSIIELDLPLTKYALAIYYTIMTVEVASNLERYDGIRFAPQILANVAEVEPFFSARELGFGDEPKRRIMLGTFASSSGFYDAYYNRAEKVMTALRQQFTEAFQQVDLIITPTSPEFPFIIGYKSDNPLAMYLSDIMTISANLTRIPAINVPAGLVEVPDSSNLTVEPKTSKLPVGCQIMGPEFSEDKIYKLAFEIEQIVLKKFKS